MAKTQNAKQGVFGAIGAIGPIMANTLEAKQRVFGAIGAIGAIVAKTPKSGTWMTGI